MTPTDLVTTRKRLGLTQAELATALSIDLRTVQRWEGGERSIPPYLALALKALAD